MNANKIVYALSADYIGLCSHKLAKDQLNNITDGENTNSFIHENGKYVDFYSLKDMICFRDILQNPTAEQCIAIDKAIALLHDAIIAFENVIQCEKHAVTEMGNEDKWYLWQSYAGYNKARCEYILHFISLFYKRSNKIDYNNWYDDLNNAVEARFDDYAKAISIINFPHIISFNLHAEYFHALFEREIYEKMADFFFDNFTKKETKNKGESFEAWQRESLSLNDILSVSKKQGRIMSLSNDIEKVTAITKLDSIINSIEEKSETLSKKEKVQFIDLISEFKTLRNSINNNASEDVYDSLLRSVIDCIISLKKKGIEFDGKLSILNNLVSLAVNGISLATIIAAL